MNAGAGGIFRPGWSVYIIPAIIYLIAAFYFGSVNRDPVNLLDFDWKDKLMHVLVFGGMHWTHARAGGFVRPDVSYSRIAVVAFCTTTVAGGALELWQFLLPHRSADWGDLAADAVGAAIAGSLFWLKQHKKSQTLAKAP